MRKKDDDEHESAAKKVHAMLAELVAELVDELGEVSLEMAIKHLPAVPSVSEVKELLDCARIEPRDYLMLRIFYYSGMRVGELAALLFADVFDDGRLFVREGKGGWDRYVLVDAGTLQLIRHWQNGRPPTEAVIGLEERQIDAVVETYGKRAGLVQKYRAMERSFSPHSLRHAFATHRYDAGMDLATIQQLLGHRYLTTTLIYVRTSMKHMLKSYHRSDPLRGR